MTAALIARLLCDRCGRSPLPPERPCDAVCTCLRGQAALAAEVRRRHTVAVRLAAHRARTRAGR